MQTSLQYLAVSLMLSGCASSTTFEGPGCGEAESRQLGHEERGDLGVSAAEVAHAVRGLAGSVTWAQESGDIPDVELMFVDATVKGVVLESTRDAEAGHCMTGTWLEFEMRATVSLDGESTGEGEARISARSADLADITFRYWADVILRGGLNDALNPEGGEAERAGWLEAGRSLEDLNVDLWSDSNGAAVHGTWLPE